MGSGCICGKKQLTCRGEYVVLRTWDCWAKWPNTFGTSFEISNYMDETSFYEEVPEVKIVSKVTWHK
jgi:hypothetical protein